MSLKVELKPGERIIIGDVVVTNADQRTRLYIDGQAPILREKDILTAETADSPARRIYFAIQMMYLDNDIAKLREQYFELVNDFVAAVPSALSIADEINNEILTGSLYKALRVAKRLIAYEEELLADAQSGLSGGGISVDGQEDSDPPRD